MFFTCWLMHENIFMIHLNVDRTVADCGAKVGLKGKVDQKFWTYYFIIKEFGPKVCGSKINAQNIFSNTLVDQKRTLPVSQVYVVFDKICD